MSAPDLARSIRRRLCDAEDNKEFVPDDAIQEFTSRNAVQTYLMANQQALPEDIAMQPLIDYVIDHDKPAKRVFLILELCNSMKYLTILRDAGFCDKDLPIEAKWSRDEDRYIVCTKVSSSNSKVTHAVFDSWIDNDIRFFRDTQWLFMAPVFVPNRFDYEMDNNCPLPIQKRIDHDKGGYSGAVYEVTIHQAHLQIELNGKGVASKEMHSAKREYFKKEADSLRLLHRLGHPHLIQPLAAYRRGNLLGFLFPWAGGGTLREFWEKHQRARTQDGMEALVRWVVSQLRGLSGATTAMHEENCRHTDLKPLNILLFEEETSLGTLCIADVGLAKIHEDDTEQRKLMNALATKARTGTERYIPPEFGHVNQLSRVFDVWSLGCVFLEFLIWTVYGWDELQNFIAGTKQFWQDRRGRLDSEVDKYIVHLKQVLDAENSSIALRECLRLVTDGMLVWDWDQRSQIATTHAKLKKICQRGDNDAGYLLKMEIPISEETLESVSMSGFNAQEVEIPELSILEDREIRKFHGDWQLLIDNEFARHLFDGVHMQTSYVERIHEELCSRCTDIWNMNFVIFEQMMKIQKRSQHCSVCGLIYSAGKEKGLGDTDNLSCRRVGSAVRVDPDGPTILSLFADPNFPAPPETQLGYAHISEPGSDFQIALLKQWIRVCDGEHNHQFDSHTKLPTRILDLGTAEKPLLCLRDGVSLGVAPYIALSHCWGTGNRFITLKSNLEEHKKHIGLELLPETFKDAVRIARALNYRFLWIDSLCIVQDDLQDWENEGASMEQVFSSANVTIAASSSASSEEGFLSVTRNQTASVTVRTPSNGTGFICKSIDNFHRDVESSVLNNRGWVFQERALSRRTIHFTSSQVYWECGNGIHCESLMKLKNPKTSFLGDSEFPNSALGYFKGARILLFQDLYQTYSALSFSHITDRCIAIKGLEERLLRVFGTKGGFGVFDRYLHRSLLWKREQGSILVPVTYPDGKGVPSWSWMAYSGRISYLAAPFDGIDWKTDVLSPFTSKSGHRQHWKAGLTTSPYLLRGIGRKFKMDAAELSERVTFDEERKTGSVEDLRCVVFGIDRFAGMLGDFERYVLLVKPRSPRDGKLYMRCGVGRMLAKHISEDSSVEIDIQ